MSTLTEGPRGLNHLLSHQHYPTNGVRHPALPLSHLQTNSPLSSTTSEPNRSQPEGMQLRSSRRLPKVPDWADFYKNGLPTEVIVIDDSPEPAMQTTTVNRDAHDNNHSLGGLTAGSSGKKRKIDDTTSQASYKSSQFLNRSRNKYSVDSYQVADRDTLPASSVAAAPTEDSSVRTGQKRKRTRHQHNINGVEPKRQGTNILKSFHVEYKGLGRKATKAADPAVRVVRDDVHKDKKVKIDDDDGHYIVIPDTDLANQYRITRLLGQGTFGKVVQAMDLHKNELVAVKVIRAVQKYRDAAKIELRALQTLRQNDAENKYRCIHLRDCFDFRGHICIVTDLLDLSLFDFLKHNNFVPFPNSHIQSFAHQLLTSVAFLHDLNLIHTDLKPENILLCDARYQTFTYNRRIPSSQLSAIREAAQRRVLLRPEIRLIDFGSATFQDEYHSSVVSTRHYRAPEIILGLGWSFPCDIWSIGCILIEFFTGDALFQTHDNLEHLAMIEAVCDTKIDLHLVQQVRGNNPSKYFKRGKLDYPNPDTTRASRRFVKNMRRLVDIIPYQNNSFLRNFLDLLKKIFVYDPEFRITAKEALQHAWFKEVIYDDGTEAAKLLSEKKSISRRSQSSSRSSTA